VELETLEGGEGGDPDELTMEAVMNEVNRIAIGYPRVVHLLRI